MSPPKADFSPRRFLKSITSCPRETYEFSISSKPPKCPFLAFGTSPKICQLDTYVTFRATFWPRIFTCRFWRSKNALPAIFPNSDRATVTFDDGRQPGQSARGRAAIGALCRSPAGRAQRMEEMAIATATYGATSAGSRSGRQGRSKKNNGGRGSPKPVKSRQIRSQPISERDLRKAGMHEILPGADKSGQKRTSCHRGIRNSPQSGHFRPRRMVMERIGWRASRPSFERTFQANSGHLLRMRGICRR